MDDVFPVDIRFLIWLWYACACHFNFTCEYVNMNSVRVVHWAEYFALWQNGWCFTPNEWIKIVPIGNFPLLQNHFPAYFVIVYSVFRNFVGLSLYLYVFSSQWIYLLMDCAYFRIVTWVCSQYPCRNETVNLSFSSLLPDVLNYMYVMVIYFD